MVYDNIPTLVTVVLFLLRIWDVTSAIIGRVVYSYIPHARRISFEINLNSKEFRWAGHEYMNKPPPPPELVF